MARNYKVTAADLMKKETYALLLSMYNKHNYITIDQILMLMTRELLDRSLKLLTKMKRL